MMNKKALFIIVGLILFCSGYFLGVVGFQKQSDDPVSEIREKGYTYISPLLDYQEAQETSQKQIVDLKVKIIDYILEQKNKSGVEHVSVYFRDLNNGPWFGIDEKEGFSPASLLKVPILIGLLKMTEKNPSLLQKEIVFNPINDGVTQVVSPSQIMVAGQKYNNWNLIERMILYSDNQAKNMLLYEFKNEDMEEVYKDLGISPPTPERPEDFMNVKEYASFFRILYNASYLSKQMSNKALELLSKVDYRDGLSGGVPSGTTVAHKFGEREFGNLLQLHDCGIVYTQSKPYLLCIMTRGRDWRNLSKTIQTISKMVYQAVSPN